jgi:glycosyltransferase involved in cell wall biosynthesis
MKELDIVIPVYNSSFSIGPLIEKINHWAEKSTLNLHVIFVDDGSQDDTFNVLKNKLNTAKFTYKTIKLAKNYGQHTATAIGFSYTSNKLIATIDDDLQHDPADIENMYEYMIQNDCDLVYGNFDIKEHHFIRNLGSKILQKILKLDGRDYKMVTSYRLMKNSAISVLKNKSTKVYFIDDYLLMGSTNVGTCPVFHAKSQSGTSRYSNWKLMKMAISIVVLHSSLPLKLISRFGLLMSFVFFITDHLY